MSSKLCRRALVACLVVLAPTACGGDDDDVASSNPSPVSTDAEVEAPTTAGGSTTVGDGSTVVGVTSAADGTSPGTVVDSAGLDPSRPVSWYGTNTLSQWDPTKSSNQSNDIPFFTQVYDRLIQLEADNALAPALATSWEFNDDGTMLTMSLRDDVVFHDGGVFDAANAVENLNRNRADGSILAPTLAGISDVTATGTHEIEITLARPDPTILYQLASTSSSMVSPDGLSNPAGLAEQPAGSGPFEFVSYDGITVTLRRHEGYWDTSAVFPESKTMWTVTDDAARLNAVSTGAADMTTLRPTQWPEIEALVERGEVEVYRFDALSQYAIYLNGSSGPLSDPVVRKAISMAIDRSAISDSLLNGLCTPSSQVVPPGFPGHDDELPAADEFDPEGAIALLEESGVEPFTVRALVAEAGFYAQFGQVIQAQLAEIGITMELTPTPLASMKATWRAGEFDMMPFQFTPQTPDPISIIDNDYLGPEGVAATVDGLQPLVDAARPLELGSAERAEALTAISSLLFEQPLHVTICSVPGIYVFQPGLLGADNVPNQLREANIPDTRNLIWSSQ